MRHAMILILSVLIKQPFLSAVLLSIALTNYAGPLWAGGLYLQEFATPSMGVASAGAEAVCTDASTAFHNPAGMTRLEGNEIMLCLGGLKTKSEFDTASQNTTPGGDGGDAGGYGPMLGSFYTRSLSEDLKFGISLFSISGALLDYDDDWAGRYQCQEVSIITLTLNPSIAYRVNDWMSVGAGVGVMYGKLELELATPPLLPNGNDGKAELDGDDVDVGFNLGALLELSEQTRFGVIYWSKIEPSYSGDLKFKRLDREVGSDTDLTFPQFIRAGVYHEINEKWALLGTVAWEDWSEMGNLLISTNLRSAKVPRNWDDTWHFAGGVHYRIDDQWLLQGGIAYDTNPVDAKDRTADMPIDRQVRFTLGVQHKWDEKVSSGFVLEYVDFGSAKIKGSSPLTGDFVGEYDKNEAFLLAFNVNWK